MFVECRYFEHVFYRIPSYTTNVSLKLSSAVTAGKPTEQCRTVSKSLIEKKRIILSSMHHLNNLRHLQADLRITSLFPVYPYLHVTTCFRYVDQTFRQS